MSIVQQATGTFTGTAFTVALPAASSPSNLVVVTVAANTTITTPAGFTLRTSQVNLMGHYLLDAAGGAASWAFACSAGQGTWWVAEIAGGAYDTALSANTAGAAISYATPSLTPSAGRKLLIASIGSTATVARTSSGWTNSFIQQADVCYQGADYPMQGVATLEAPVSGSTAYSSGMTYSSDSTGRTAIIGSYVTTAGPPSTLAGVTVWLRAKDNGASGSSVPTWAGQDLAVHNATAVGTAPTVATASTPNGGKSIRFSVSGMSLPSAKVLGLSTYTTDALASSQYSPTTYSAQSAVDGTTTGDVAWVAGANATAGAPQWLRLQPAAGTVATSYAIYPRAGSQGNAPKDWTFQGSNDGAAWTTLDTRTGVAFAANTGQTFTFSNSTAYTYYRVLVTATTSGTGPDICEMQINGVANSITHNPGEMWVVIKSDGGSGPNSWSYGTSGSSSHYPYGTDVYDDFGNATRRQFTPSLATTAWRIYRVGITAAGGWFAHIDNVSQLTASGVTKAWTAGVVSVAGSFAANIAEVLVRTQVSTASEVADLITYFNTEHGLTVAGGSSGSSGAAGLSGAGTLGTAATLSTVGVATLAGGGVLGALGAQPGALAGAGTLAAGATVGLTGLASLAGSGALGATSGTLAGSADLSGSGLLGAAVALGVAGAAVLTGVGTLVATASSAGLATVALTGTGVLSCSTVLRVRRGVDLTGSGALSVARLGPSSHTVSFLVGLGVRFFFRLHARSANQTGIATLVWSTGVRASTVDLQPAGPTGTTVYESPAWLPVTVAAGTPGGTVQFALSGSPAVIGTAVLNPTGNLPSTSVLISAPAGAYTLTVTDVTTGAIGSLPIAVTRGAPTYPIAPTPLPYPTFAPPVEVVNRWVLIDPAVPADTYYMPINPDSMSPPHAARVYTSEHSTATDGQPITFEGGAVAVDWQVNGTVLTQAFYETLERFHAKGKRLLVVDHLRRAWLVTFEALDMTPKRVQNNPWAHAWKAKFNIYAGPIDLPRP